MEEMRKLFIELGYTEKDYLEIKNSYPLERTKEETLIKKVKENYDFLLSLGYSKEDVIKMTKSLPGIYSLSIENIKQKIEFYDSIGLHSLAIDDTKKLMQSTKLSYARYMFYKEKGIIINEKNYGKLFINQKEFEKVYGITKESLLEMYPYEDRQEGGDKKEKSTQELGKETRELQKDVIGKEKMCKMLDERANEIKKQVQK